MRRAEHSKEDKRRGSCSENKINTGKQFLPTSAILFEISDTIPVLIVTDYGGLPMQVYIMTHMHARTRAHTYNHTVYNYIYRHILFFVTSIRIRRTVHVCDYEVLLKHNAYMIYWCSTIILVHTNTLVLDYQRYIPPTSIFVTHLVSLISAHFLTGSLRS